MSLKRSIDGVDGAAHGFFASRSTKLSFEWMGVENESCLWGRCGIPDQSKSKIAAFDLDGVLIKTKSGVAIARDAEDFEWWHPTVLTRLRSLAKDETHQIVIFTNQALNANNFKKWKRKVTYLAPILNVPFTIYAAADIDHNRKPQVGMWEILCRQMRELEPDMSHSFFVGDAAGRAADHSDSDRKLAENIGIKFYTPEEYFLGKEPAVWSYRPHSFHPKMLHQPVNLWSPQSTSLASTGQESELILFVGSPGIGKTSFYRRHLQDAGYVWINQDTLRSRGACLDNTEMHLRKGHRIVVDNTNRDIETRACYIRLAKQYKIKIRVFWFTAPTRLAIHNNLYRALVSPDLQHPRTLLPPSAFTNYDSQFEVPDRKEGFDELIKIHFKFEGSSEEHKKWFRWLRLDGRRSERRKPIEYILN